MKLTNLVFRLARSASSLAALALANPSAHAAPTVWNVNIGSDVTTSHNFVGAAPENTTPNSFWNSFVEADLPSAKVLADPSGNPTPVTMSVTAPTLPTIGGQNQNGAAIFDRWMKAASNSVDFTVTFAGLDPAEAYDLVVYADWYWEGAAIAITQSSGTGLAAPFTLNYGKSSDGVDNDTGPLNEDTNPANVGSGTLNWNHTRLKTLTPDGSGNLAFLIDGGNWPISGFQLVKIDLGDTTPPNPDPMTWASVPAETSPYSITMTADTASDPSGVEYKFTETTGNPGATSSTWQDSPTYTDTGLTPATLYTYNVTARDKSPGLNETAASAAASATTDPADATPPTPNPATWDTLPVATGEASVTMTATTATDLNGVEYLFTETSGNPGATSSTWQDSPTYTDTGLNPGTTYKYTVTARDKSPAQNQTTASAEASVTTDPLDTTAPAPDPMSFDIAPAAASITKVTMTATTASDANGVEYYFTETSGNPGGSDSGWQDSPVYTDAGLTPGTSYTYKVKARDKSITQNATADSTPAPASTDTETVVSSVWNVNIGNEITTSDNFAGAAPENTVPNSFWNSVIANPTGLVLADATSSNSAGVTLTLTDGSQPIAYGGYAPVTGIDLFSTWLKSSDNATPYTMTIGGLSASKTYDLIIYSDWYWKGNETLPLTLTAGTGLSGTVTLDQISTATDGAVPALVQDTNLALDGATEGNWLRIKGLTPDVNGNLGFLMGGTNAAFSGFQLVYPAVVVSSGFTIWAAANAGGQTAGEDFDNDGVENGVEFFMGETGSSITANPSLNASNEITWPASAAYQGTYEVQTSPDLVSWTPAATQPTPSGGFLTYTLPPGAPGGKSFVRLLVTPTP